ncbi:MAG: hypothetical protein COW18_04100 [Zetaproteobacteria bacterium CG12_big_fil_rev_8_21_14_0_65_54_13]|nr:MAG: hypothetical protein COW18_04100 [Zetaproteobacteria bacterium CG12_big_fil_rev_8_21_14_0_65_54_13]PIX54624.1 MAG: hypothetical protein COZ50_07000 [Zetaproteobacteria bacterium CG_4_10_14_3_um_filter_54_28]PJA30688.1 MAG: hypothetical protein CO188_02375 [Zetaproteobacteria bacterium CG_4_9_14_3_um_filter_54_145]
MYKFIAGGLLMAAMAASPVWAGEAAPLIGEAEAVRAQELSPASYAAAKDAYAAQKTAEAERYAQQAITNSLSMSRNFPKLIESRDRMHASGTPERRQDLSDRAEEAFADVVAAVESGDMRRARKSSETATLLTYQAEVVAAREQLTRPIARAIAEARKADGKTYAPLSFGKAADGLKKVERLVSSNPAARGQLYNESRNSVESARTSQQIAGLGKQLKKDPAQVEGWVNSRNNDMATIALALKMNLGSAATSDERVKLITEAIASMRSGYELQLTETNQQLADASKQIATLQGNLSELDDTRSSLGQARYTLQLKRDAEAKIARLAKLFDPSQVELFLTTDADVIIRMKAIAFPSGSAIIPSESYDLLELASQAIDLFDDRAVRVEGHTDSMGNDDYNQSLSERRAITVQEYLDARFIDNKRTITSTGFGESRPVANNEKAEGRSKNRRIDIVLLAPVMSEPQSAEQ